MVSEVPLYIAAKKKRFIIKLEIHLLFYRVITYSNPPIPHYLINCQSLGRFNVQHSAYQIFRVLAHVLPFRIRKRKLTHPDPFFHTRGDCEPVVTIKRWKTTQPKSKNTVRKKIIDS